MIVIKPGNYEPELEGTCPRCGQVERFDLFETDEENNKSCTLCGYFMNMTNKPEPIDRPSEEITFLEGQKIISDMVNKPKINIVDPVKASRKLEDRLEDMEIIDRPSIREMVKIVSCIQDMSCVDVAVKLLETFDIRRKK